MNGWKRIAGITLCLWLTGAPAFAAMNDFTGAWENADPATRDINRLIIRHEGGHLLIHVWGACRPSACGWGERRAVLFVPDRTVPLALGADAARVVFDRGSVRRTVFLALDAGALRYDTFTAFRHTLRTNYHASGLLRRAHP